MQYFNFARLINKYSKEFTAIIPSKGGYNDTGDYEQSVEEVTLTGAIIEHNISKVFRTEGTITQQDRALYMLSPLDKALEGAKVVFEGNTYHIGEMLANGEYTGVWYYNLKYVSAFNENSTCQDFRQVGNEKEAGQ